MLKRSARVGFGFLLLLVGLIGWLLPVSPGWPFVIPGLLILSKEFHWARRLLGWLRSHFPKQAARSASPAKGAQEPVGKKPGF